MTQEQEENEAQEEAKPSELMASTATWYFVGGLTAAVFAAGDMALLLAALATDTSDNDPSLVAKTVFTLLLVGVWTLLTYAAGRFFVGGALRVRDALHARSIEFEYPQKYGPPSSQSVPRR